MLKSGRLYIYASLALIIVMYNFIFEVVFSSMNEAIIETLVLYPMVFIFLIAIYRIRAWALRVSFFQTLSTARGIRRNLFVIGLISVKALLIAVLSKIITSIALEAEEGSFFFDWLFITILVSVLVVIIFIYFFEEYLNSIQEKHKMTTELSRYESEKMLAKYHSLKKQLNPHFLFNSFNSLISLIPVNAQSAEKFVEELSNIYRYNLSKSDELVVKLSEELEMIQSYIHLQRIRFGAALTYEESSNCDKEKVLLPPMTLQLLVENAIKHNKISKTQPLSIQVKTDQNFVTVTNNLQPKQKQEYKADSFGIGLNNLKNQLKLITNQPLEITKDEYAYTVKVPLINTELDD
jgi:sensor histidine kinase YesM